MAKTSKLNILPPGWVWSTIGDLGIIVSGGTPSTRNPQYWGGEVCWVTPADLSNFTEKFVSNGKRYLTKEGLAASSATLLPEGSIIFSSRAPIGYVAITKTKLATNQGFKNIIPTKSLYIDYVFFYLQSAKQLAEDSASGTTFLELSAEKFRNLPIPVPPVEEQKRIVSKIEEYLSELKQADHALKIAQRQINLYRQVLLKLAFEGKLTANWRNGNLTSDGKELLSKVQSERVAQFNSDLSKNKQDISDWEKAGKVGQKPKPVRKLSTNTVSAESLPKLPEKWIWTTLGEITYKIGDIDHKMPKSLAEGIPYLSTGDITSNNKLDFESAKRISPLDFERLASKIKPEKGDIIFPRYGTIGRNVLVHTDREFLVSYSCAIIKNVKSLIDPRYVYQYSMSPLAKSEIKKYTVETTQANVGIGSIEKFIFPLCSLEEQRQIADELEFQISILINLEDSINQCLMESVYLKESIFKNAFSGNFDTSNIEDENATDFLKRISEEKEQYLLSEKKNKKKMPTKIKKQTLLNIITENYGHKKFSFEDLKENISLPYEDFKEQFYILLEDETIVSEFSEEKQRILFNLIK